MSQACSLPHWALAWGTTRAPAGWSWSIEHQTARPGSEPASAQACPYRPHAAQQAPPPPPPRPPPSRRLRRLSCSTWHAPAPRPTTPLAGAPLSTSTAAPWRTAAGRRGPPAPAARASARADWRRSGRWWRTGWRARRWRWAACSGGEGVVAVPLRMSPQHLRELRRPPPGARGPRRRPLRGWTFQRLGGSTGRRSPPPARVRCLRGAEPRPR
mmetsp:Transcript_28983/g.55521  ORF Transcript_28983/g.55521 Transcript_28983/m.55521 type:complete len:213 (+) Transcript_28983:840-1478(+)